MSSTKRRRSYRIKPTEYNGVITNTLQEMKLSFLNGTTDIYDQ